MTDLTEIRRLAEHARYTLSDADPAAYRTAAIALAREMQRYRNTAGSQAPLYSGEVVPDAALEELQRGLANLPAERDDRAVVDRLNRHCGALIEALGHSPTDPLAVFRRPSEITEPPSATILSAYGQGGAILPEGEIMVITGAGGQGKSAMLGDIALAVACSGTDRHAGHIIRAHGPDAPVLWLAFEEPVTNIRDRLGVLDPDGSRGRERIRLADMRSLQNPAERLLFGPAPEYPYRVQRQPGMDLLERSLEAAGEADPQNRMPRLVIVDTLLRGFSGDPHRATDVVSFLDALGLVARRYQCGIIGVAHATKAVRGGRETPDELLDPGQLSGHGQWIDAPRTTLCLTGHRDIEAGRYHRLTIVKTNVGPDGLTIRILAERMIVDGGRDGPIRRFTADGERWQSVYDVSRDAVPHSKSGYAAHQL